MTAPRQEKAAPEMPIRSLRRRDSLEDHLQTASRALLQIGLNSRAGSRNWVRDLIRDGLIAPPIASSKIAGRGRRFRLTPEAYRDLIEIMRLRTAGVKHRSTWTLWLWLRGRKFPIDRIRKAAIADLKRQLRVLRNELYPSGRFQEPFLTKYRRNIAPTRETSPFFDLNGVEEPLAAMMMRPQEAADIPIDLRTIVRLLAESLGAKALDVEGLVNIFATSPDLGVLSSGLASLTNNEQVKGALAIFEGTPLSDLAASYPIGFLDNGRGGSAALTTLTKASDVDFCRVRKLIQAIRTGSLERQTQLASFCAPLEERSQLLFAADYTAEQRRLMRGNPELSGYFIALYLHNEGDK